jgi:hypothetical protein
LQTSDGPVDPVRGGTVLRSATRRPGTEAVGESFLQDRQVVCEQDVDTALVRYDELEVHVRLPGVLAHHA